MPQPVTVEETAMLLNHIELDVKTKCIEESITQAKIAEELGTTPGYISRIVNGKEHIVNKTYVAMMELLGYDVELTYVKRH
jgi:transcriptional regulator with XRE-family HTH domain